MAVEFVSHVKCSLSILYKFSISQTLLQCLLYHIHLVAGIYEARFIPQNGYLLNYPHKGIRIIFGPARFDVCQLVGYLLFQ